MSKLQFEQHIKKDHILFDLQGDLTIHEIKEFDKVVSNTIEDGKSVTIDCSKLVFMDSSGIGLFVKFWNIAQNKNVSLWMIKPADEMESTILEYFFISQSGSGKAKFFSTKEDYLSYLNQK